MELLKRNRVDGFDELRHVFPDRLICRPAEEALRALVPRKRTVIEVADDYRIVREIDEVEVALRKVTFLAKCLLSAPTLRDVRRVDVDVAFIDDRDERQLVDMRPICHFKGAHLARCTRPRRLLAHLIERKENVTKKQSPGVFV